MENSGTSKAIYFIGMLLVVIQLMVYFSLRSDIDRLSREIEKTDAAMQQNVKDLKTDLSDLDGLNARLDVFNKQKRAIDSLQSQVHQLESEFETLNKKSAPAEIKDQPALSIAPAPNVGSDATPNTSPDVAPETIIEELPVAVTQFQTKRARFDNSELGDAFVALLPEGSRVTMLLKNPDGGVIIEYLTPEDDQE